MDNPKKNVYRRRNYFIEKKFQTAFILKFCALVALGGALMMTLLYFFAMKSNTVAFVNSRVVVRTTADFLLPVLIQTVLIMMVFVGIATIFLTLFVSHKIAGPLFRFKRAIGMLEKGDFSESFRIRKSDQLQDLAGTFDRMIAKLRGDFKELSGKSHLLQEKLSDMPEWEIPEDKRAHLKELKRACSDLNGFLSRFKI